MMMNDVDDVDVRFLSREIGGNWICALSTPGLPSRAQPGHCGNMAMAPRHRNASATLVSFARLRHAISVIKGASLPGRWSGT
jgi:hypothetical protein